MNSTAPRFIGTARLLEELRDLLQSASASPGHDLPHRGLDEAFGRLQPWLGGFGITRVADLTGLDVIGIPVFAAYRPNSRSLAASMGKGLTPDGARLGAVMESLEQAFSERAEDIVVAVGSRRELTARGLRPLDPARFLRYSAGEGDDRERAWVAGISAATFAEVLAPFELIGLDLREDAGWDLAAFRMSSVGLAAHTSLAGAALNALLELVENDATAPLEMLGLNPPFAKPLRHEPSFDQELDDAIAKVAAAGLGLSFHSVSGRVGLPIVAAFLEPIGAPLVATDTRLFAGFGCRPTVADAALAALLEAVQSRLTHISGARDDIAPQQYRQRSGRPRGAATGALTMRAAQQATPISTESTLAGQLRHVLATVLKSGVDDVFLFPLAGIGDDLRVVRVLAPAMQAAAPDGPVRLGTSAIDMILKRAGRQ